MDETVSGRKLRKWDWLTRDVLLQGVHALFAAGELRSYLDARLALHQGGKARICIKVGGWLVFIVERVAFRDVVDRSLAIFAPEWFAESGLDVVRAARLLEQKVWDLSFVRFTGEVIRGLYASVHARGRIRAEVRHTEICATEDAELGLLDIVELWVDRGVPGIFWSASQIFVEFVVVRFVNEDVTLWSPKVCHRLPLILRSLFNLLRINRYKSQIMTILLIRINLPIPHPRHLYMHSILLPPNISRQHSHFLLIQIATEESSRLCRRVGDFDWRRIFIAVLLFYGHGEFDTAVGHYLC